MVSIKNLDKATVLAELYNNSKQLGLGFLNQRGYNSLSYNEAVELLKQSTYFDYLYGRVLKVDLSGDEFDESMYDIDNGQGAAKKVIDHIKNKSDNVLTVDEALLNYIYNDNMKDNLFQMTEEYEENLTTERESKILFYNSFNPEDFYTDEEKEIEQRVINEYDKVIFTYADSGVYFVVKNNKFGAVSVSTGNLIIPCEYGKYFEIINEWKAIRYSNETLDKSKSRSRQNL